jgi:hypothetical protein
MLTPNAIVQSPMWVQIDLGVELADRISTTNYRLSSIRQREKRSSCHNREAGWC